MSGNDALGEIVPRLTVFDLRENRMQSWFSQITVSSLFSLLVAMLAGCANVSVEPDGTRHVTGFMMLTLPPVHRDIGADVVRMRTFGLTVTSDPATGAQVTLGYSDTTMATMRNDAVVSRIALRHATHGFDPKEE